MKNALQNIQIKRSSRKTMALEITTDLQIIIRAPYWVSDHDIRHFAKEKEGWIQKHWDIMKQRQNLTISFLSADDIKALATKALKVIPEKVSVYAKKLNVSYGKITIRNQKTRWGSCSSKGNLNFNCLLMLVPEDIMDYVIIHELCHRKEMNHSKNFWKEVENILPDYKEKRKWLRDNGASVIARMKK